MDNTIDSIFSELKKFSSEIVQLAEPISDNRIDNFEIRNNLKLPEDYKKFMLISNGLSALSNELLVFLGNDEIYSMEYVYKRYVQHLPKKYLPICPDGAGNYYCLNLFDDTNIHYSCEVIFWQHDYLYSKDDLPEVSNESFLDFIKEVFIDWTLEDYNYNGKQK